MQPQRRRTVKDHDLSWAYTSLLTPQTIHMDGLTLNYPIFKFPLNINRSSIFFRDTITLLGGNQESSYLLTKEKDEN